jgi:hypothetical protein
LNETKISTWADTIGAALDSLASQVTPEGDSRWTFALTNPTVIELRKSASETKAVFPLSSDEGGGEGRGEELGFNEFPVAPLLAPLVRRGAREFKRNVHSTLISTTAPTNRGSRLVTAKIAGCWLALEADFYQSPNAPAKGPAFFGDLLVWNATLPGLVKFVLTTEGSVRLRADLPLHEGIDIAARIREASAGFVFAWPGEPTDPAAPSGTDSPGTADVEPINLKQICSEAGWPFVERASGKLAVELEVVNGFYQALMVPTARGVQIGCDLATCDAAPPVCRQAIGGLLLAASGAVRLVRAAIAPGEVPPMARFEVVFAGAPCPSELASALESLSVACSHCGEEINMLQDHAVAQRYLELRGWI